jgi:hypothetical protein
VAKVGTKDWRRRREALGTDGGQDGEDLLFAERARVEKGGVQKESRKNLVLAD